MPAHAPETPLDRLKQRDRLQTALIELGRKAAVLSDPDGFMRQAAEIIAKALETECAEVMELTSDRAEMTLVAGAGWAQRLAGQLREAVGASSYGCQALRTAAPILIKGAKEQDVKFPEWLRARGARNGIRVCVRVRGEAWGIIGAHSQKARNFAKDEISFMRVAAHLVGLFVTRAYCEDGVQQHRQEIRASLRRIRLNHQRLMEHIRRKNFELAATRGELQIETKGRHRAEDTLRLLVDAMAVTTEAAGISLMLAKCLEIICQRRGWDAGQAWMRDPAVNQLRCVPDAVYAACDISAFRSACLAAPFVEGVGMPGEVWKKCEAVWSGDLSAYTDSPHAALAVQAGLRTAFALPLCVGKEFLGVLEFLSAEIRPPDSDWLDAMTRLGNHVGVVLLRRESEARLRREKALTDSLIRSSSQGIFAFDLERRITIWNPAMEQLTGIPAGEILGRRAFEAAPVLGEMGEDSFIEETLQGKSPEGKDRPYHVKGSGERRFFESYYSPLWESSGRPDDPWEVTGGLAIIRDSTERKKFEESLRHLSGRLLRLQDEERRRLARELHDSTAQTLAALSLHLSILEQRAGKLSLRALASLGECQALAQQAHNEIRNFSHLLHPPVLEEVGLLGAIRGYAGGFRNTTGIALDLDLPEELERLPQETEIALFRIFQEALSNVHRHSGSPSATVRLISAGTQLTLEVADQGKGMPGGLLGALGVTRMGIGIVGMQERLKQLGGRMEIESSNAGTIVRAILSMRAS